MKVLILFGAILSAALAGAQSDLDSRLRASKQLMSQGNAAAAEQTLRAALEEATLLPPGDIRTALVLNNVGAACNEQGRFREAAGFYKRAVDSCVGDCRRFLAARLTANLANAYLAAGDLAAAERMDLGALIDRLPATAPRDAEFARLLMASGDLSSKRSRPVEAEQYYRRALDVLENMANPDLQILVLLLHDLALVHVQTGRIEEAASLSERVYAIAFSEFQEGDPARALAASGLGTIRLLTRRYDEAEQLYASALATSQKAFGPTHPLVGHIFGLNALLLERTNRKSKAKLYRKHAAAILAGSQDNYGSHIVDLQDLLREASRR